MGKTQKNPKASPRLSTGSSLRDWAIFYRTLWLKLQLFMVVLWMMTSCNSSKLYLQFWRVALRSCLNVGKVESTSQFSWKNHFTPVWLHLHGPLCWRRKKKKKTLLKVWESTFSLVNIVPLCAASPARLFSSDNQTRVKWKWSFTTRFLLGFST